MTNLDKITVPKIIGKKQKSEKIVCLTAYDWLLARLLDQAGVDVILVGDSAGMVFHGYKTTLPVTLDQMLDHTRAVARGVSRALIVSDMPFLSYQASTEQAIQNAGLGLTPQSIQKFGGYRIRGKSSSESEELIKDARILEEAGVFAIVLEKAPADLAKKITESISIPTIGIGAGPHCDGQILVTQDILGMFEDFRPKFVRRYANLAETIRDAVTAFADDVRSNQYPSKDESF